MPEWLSILLGGIGGAILATSVTIILTWQSIWTPYGDASTRLALEIDHLFTRHAHLRGYFYDEHPFPTKDHDDHSLAQAIRELVADCLEGIWDNQDIYNEKDWNAWLKYIQDMMETSPGLTTLLVEDDPEDPLYPGLQKAIHINRTSYRRPHFRRLKRFARDVAGK